MEDHVHARQRGGGVVHFLPVEREVEAGAVLRLIVRLEQQRRRAAGGIVDGLAGAFRTADADDHRDDAGDFRRAEELPLALARLDGEVPHEVFVGVAQQVVPLGAVAPEIERGIVEDGDEIRETVHHVLALAELVRVVEIRHVDHALEVIRLREPADDLVDLVANFLVALERHHVRETPARGDIHEGIRLSRVLVRDVFHEQQHEHVVLILRGIHPAAQFVAALPEGGVEFGFLEGHEVSFSKGRRARVRSRPRCLAGRGSSRRGGGVWFHGLDSAGFREAAGSVDLSRAFGRKLRKNATVSAGRKKPRNFPARELQFSHAIGRSQRNRQGAYSRAETRRRARARG